MYRKYLVIILLLLGVTSCSPKEDDTKSSSELQIDNIKRPEDNKIEEKIEEKQNLELAPTDAESEKTEEKQNLESSPANIESEKPRGKKDSLSSSGFFITDDDIVIGDPKSKVVIIEYFSPTCPHCVRYHKKTFPEIKAKYIDTNKIAYVLREFIAAKQDLVASILARCKGDTDTYLKFIDVILTQQENWAFDKNFQHILTNIGQIGGISPEEYAACLMDESKIKSLMENTKSATKNPHFIGTPSFFINGKHFTKPYTIEELSKEIERNLIEVK